MQEKNEEISFLYQNGGGKFGNIKKMLYLCSRFLKGVLKAPNLEIILELDGSDVGLSIHSATIEHPFSIHWKKAESRWKRKNNDRIERLAGGAAFFEALSNKTRI